MDGGMIALWIIAANVAVFLTLVEDSAAHDRAPDVSGGLTSRAAARSSAAALAPSPPGIISATRRKGPFRSTLHTILLLQVAAIAI
jgi:hypothetical protein